MLFCVTGNSDRGPELRQLAAHHHHASPQPRQGQTGHRHLHRKKKDEGGVYGKAQWSRTLPVQAGCETRDGGLPGLSAGWRSRSMGDLLTPACPPSDWVADPYETHSDGLPDMRLEADDYDDAVDDVFTRRTARLSAEHGSYDNVTPPPLVSGTILALHPAAGRKRAGLPSLGLDDDCFRGDGDGGAAVPRRPEVPDGGDCWDETGEVFGNEEYECEDVDVVRCPVTVTVTGELCGHCDGDGHHAPLQDFADSPNDSVLECQHCPFSEG